MRLNSIELAWFRGAADPIKLDLSGRSCVVFGKNGAGKSAFVDAVEFVLKDGKLQQLAHEYSGRNQEKGLPNTKRPEGKKTQIQIAFKNGEVLEAGIKTNNLPEMSGANGVDMPSWDYGRTVLRQTDVTAFIEEAKGRKYSALLPLLGLHEFEVAAENLHQLHRELEKQANVQFKKGQLLTLTQKRKKVFGDADEKVIADEIAETYKAECPKDTAKEVLKQCDEIIASLDAKFASLSDLHHRHNVFKGIAEADVAGGVSAVRTASAKLAESSETLIAERLAVLDAAAGFRDGLTTEEQVDCPACGTTVPTEEFAAHIVSEQERLSALTTSFEERKSAMGSLASSIRKVKDGLKSPLLKEWVEEGKKGKLKQHLEWIESCNPDNFREKADEAKLKEAEDSCQPLIKAAAAESAQEPEEVTALNAAKERADTAKQVFASVSLRAEIANAEKVLDFVEALEASVRKQIRERSQKAIDGISGDIKTIWNVLHPAKAITDVKLYLPDGDKAIDIGLTFYGTEQASPRLTLSEGYRHCLGLCIFFALAKSEAKADRPIILDDVVISLDKEHRGMVFNVLKDLFPDRQIIVFTHDRDWFTDLRQQLDGALWSFKALLPYEKPELGIRWATEPPGSFEEAEAKVPADPRGAANFARSIMDARMPMIAEKLKVRMPYLRGEHNDRRGGHVLLSQIAGDGKKCFQKKVSGTPQPFTDGVKALEDADKLLVTWANRASHDDIETAEAKQLIDTCKKALAHLTCTTCGKDVWFSEAASPEWVQCTCGDIRWRYGKG
jgi:DNA repair exonuclease SbcCD ATPase subunit